jgi:glycosyltransferase involved in cell wall biosynthesis
MNRICFVGLDNYPVLNPMYSHHYFGGESVQQTLLARSFVARGYSVSMIVKEYGQGPEISPEGIRVIPTFSEDDGFPVLRFLHPRITKLFGALHAANAEIYYQSCAGMVTGMTALYCKATSKRFVLRIAHDNDCIPDKLLIKYKRDKMLYELGLRMADVVLAQTAYQQELLREHYRIPSMVVDMVVEIPDRMRQDKEIGFLWVNNFRPFKRPELFLELARRHPERPFVMIGGPCPGAATLFEECRSAAQSIPNLRFLGPLPLAAVNEHIDRSLFLVNTSPVEGFPNSFLQSWVRGVPVLSFFDPDRLIQRHGLGLVPATFEEMSSLLGSCRMDPEYLARQERIREFAAGRFSPMAVTERYREQFENGW